MKKTMKLFTALITLLLLWSADGFGQIPCGGTQYSESIHCPGDTIQLTATCNSGNCTYNWQDPSGGYSVIAGQGTATATIVLRPNISHPWLPIVSRDDSIHCSITDIGQGCSYSINHYAFINHQTNRGLVALDGAWTGNTSTVYRYTFTYTHLTTGPQYYDQQPTWTVQGGTIQSVATSAPYNAPVFQLSPLRTDTVKVTWSGPNPMLHLDLRTEGNALGMSSVNHVCYLEDSLVIGMTGFITGDTSICRRDTLSYSFSAVSGASYVWTANGGAILNGQGSPAVDVDWTTGAVYLVCARTVGMTTVRDTLWMDLILPVVNAGPDQTLCAGGGTVSLTATPPADYYLWNNGATTQSILVNQAGTYIVEASYDGCTDQDTVVVTNGGPQPNIGPDFVYCASTNPQYIGAQPGFSSYLWSTGAATVSIPAPTTGDYSVTVTDASGCQGSDTVHVTVNPSPQPNLGPDQTICYQTNTVLDPGNMGPGLFSYVWSTGATTSQVTVQVPGTYGVTVTNAFGCIGTDTIIISNFPYTPLSLGNDTIICADTTVTLDAGAGGTAYNWSTGQTTQTITVTQGTYAVTVVGPNSCTQTDNITITFVPDCVFPGDADYDGLADNNDVLALGISYGGTGSTRTNASNNWYGQAGTDWGMTLPNSVDYKHSDCDGDGIVTDNDTLPIRLNYGRTHSKSSGTTGGVPLRLVALTDSVQAGDIAAFSLVLGDAQNLVDSVYGIAFTVNYDTATVDTEGLFFSDYSNCWFAGGASLSFTYDLYPEPMADLAVVRTNGTDTTGWGEVCRVGFVTIDNISGKTHTLSKALHVWLSDVRLISASMTVTATALYGDSVVVYEEGLNAPGSGNAETVSLVPVPADNYLQVKVKDGELEQVRVMDLSGKVLRTVDGGLGSAVRVETGSLPMGVYMVEVKSARTTYVKKVVVQH